MASALDDLLDEFGSDPLPEPHLRNACEAVIDGRDGRVIQSADNNNPPERCIADLETWLCRKVDDMATPEGSRVMAVCALLISARLARLAPGR